MSYRSLIVEALSKTPQKDVDPVLVEGFMRVTRPTLDSVGRPEFFRLARAAALAVVAEPELAKELAGPRRRAAN